MTKHLKISVVFVIILASINFSCSKYSEGPKISLIPKKNRISKDWKTEYSVNLETGIEHSADYDGWLLSIEKGSNYSNYTIYNNIETTFTGNWEFIGDNQIRFTYYSSNDEQIVFYTILRLSRKELWLKNEHEEIHYYSD